MIVVLKSIKILSLRVMFLILQKTAECVHRWECSIEIAM
jgi:hypothetical protein